MTSAVHMRYVGRVTLAAVVLAVLQQPQVEALQSASGQAAQVSLADVKALPDASVMVPLSFAPDTKIGLRALTVEIEYVSNSLTFEKPSPGLAAEMANVDLRANLVEGRPDDKGLKRAKVRITLSMQAPKPKEGLPEGLLAYLLFHVEKKAKPFTIKLTPTIISADDLSTPPKKIAGISVLPGSVVIENPDSVLESISPELKPDVGCFFFTH